MNLGTPPPYTSVKVLYTEITILMCRAAIFLRQILTPGDIADDGGGSRE